MLRPNDPESAKRQQGNRGAISQRTRALEAMIDSSLDALRQGQSSHPPTEALLFIGNWNDALPRLLIYDPILEPVDKIVWAVIRTRADPNRGTSFPSYAMIGRLANVGSEATVSRALSILRVTRWLTHCGRVRDRHGRFRGNVYVLHDEPLPLADTLYLDPVYMAAIHQASDNRHARVALVAAGVLRSLELDIAGSEYVVPPADPMIQRQAALLATTASNPEGPSIYGVRGRLLAQFRQQLYVTASDHLQNLKAVDDGHQPQILRTGDHLQNLKMERRQNLSPVVVVVSSNESTTTTEGQPRPAAADHPAPPIAAASPIDSIGDLRWPAQLSANHRYLSAIQLRGVSSDLRQPVLDILAQRLRAIDLGAEKLHYGPLAYLKTLCAKAAAGQLVLPRSTSIGVTPLPPHAPTLQEEEKGRLLARLRVARADHTHWQRILGLENRTDQQSVIGQLVEQAAAEVQRIESELVALDAGTPGGGSI